MKLTINFQDDTKFNRDCDEHGYQATVMDANGGAIPNPETKQQFAERILKQYFQRLSKEQRLIRARESVVVAD